MVSTYTLFPLSGTVGLLPLLNILRAWELRFPAHQRDSRQLWALIGVVAAETTLPRSLYSARRCRLSQKKLKRACIRAYALPGGGASGVCLVVFELLSCCSLVQGFSVAWWAPKRRSGKREEMRWPRCSVAAVRPPEPVVDGSALGPSSLFP